MCASTPLCLCGVLYLWCVIVIQIIKAGADQKQSPENGESVLNVALNNVFLPVQSKNLVYIKTTEKWRDEFMSILLMGWIP